MEVLISLALAVIVAGMIALFLTQGTNIFRKENTDVDLQNEAQIVSGHLETALMEAKAFIVKTNAHESYIYTGEFDADKDEWLEATGTERTIIITADSIYITERYCEDYSTLGEGFLISDNKKEFSIDVDDSCKNGDGYINPLVVNVRFKLEDSGRTKTSDITLKLRNYITVIEE